MEIGDVTLAAIPHIVKAYCPARRCDERLSEVDIGMLKKVLYCRQCSGIYELKIKRVPEKNLKPTVSQHLRKLYPPNK